MTIKRSDGEMVTLKAPPGARNFDQIKPGDSVRAEYLEAVAIFVRTPSGSPQAGENATIAVAPKGEKPRAVATKPVEVTARVEAIDEVKPGDEVVVRHTEALAIAFSK